MPNRIIKESICTSDDIDDLSWFEEVFFYRLIVNADDYGRMDGRLSILKSKLFPLKKGITEEQIDRALNKLSTVGMVQVYTHDQKPFLQLITWNSHQQIRAKKSKYPAPDNNGNQLISNDSICPRNPIQSEYESNTKSESNTHARTHAREFFVKIKDLCQQHCPIVFNRHSQKPNGDLALGQLLGEIEPLYSLTDIESVLKHASKTYIIKPKMKNLDLCWILNNFEKVKNLPEETNESSLLASTTSSRPTEIQSPSPNYTNEQINAMFDSLKPEDI